MSATISLVVMLESDQFSTLLTWSLLSQRKRVGFLASWWEVGHPLIVDSRSVKSRFNGQSVLKL